MEKLKRKCRQFPYYLLSPVSPVINTLVRTCGTFVITDEPTWICCYQLKAITLHHTFYTVQFYGFYQKHDVIYLSLQYHEE